MPPHPITGLAGALIARFLPFGDLIRLALVCRDLNTALEGPLLSHIESIHATGSCDLYPPFYVIHHGMPWGVEDTDSAWNERSLFFLLSVVVWHDIILV
jgi:hypothetical protein